MGDKKEKKNAGKCFFFFSLIVYYPIIDRSAAIAMFNLPFANAFHIEFVTYRVENVLGKTDIVCSGFIKFYSNQKICLLHSRKNHGKRSTGNLHFPIFHIFPFSHIVPSG